MIIRIAGFQGVMPSIENTMLPDSAATVAVDCKLASGSIKPLHQATGVATPAKSGTKSTIFLYHPDSGSDTWFHWVGGLDVNMVKSPLNDVWDRLYWTGDGAPKYAPYTVAITGGSGEYPSYSYTLGLPTPTVPTATRVGDPGTDATLDETRSYAIRYVSAYGEVGPPSFSNDITWSPGNTATVSLPGAGPSGAYNVATVDIFRSVTGTTSTEFQYVASVPVATASYSDSKTNDELGYVLDSTYYLQPNSAMKGLIAHPAGFLAGFYDNILCLSEAYLPHAWPAANQYALTETIVSIASFGNSILVTTTGAPFVVTGTDPGSMSVERFEEGYACVSKRGTVDMGYSVLYPTPIGLMEVGVNGSRLVTDGVCTIDEWKALSPSTMHAYAYGGRYLAISSAGNFLFNPKDGTYINVSSTNLTGAITAGFSDTSTGDMYLQAGSSIVKYDGSSTHSTYTWTSKKFVAPYPLNMAALQVFATGSVTVSVYADDVLKLTVTISDSTPVRLPGGFRATHWQVSLTGTSVVNQVLLSTSMAELSQI